jgi:hypothetical protein
VPLLHCVAGLAARNLTSKVIPAFAADSAD